ncbi:ABC-type transport system substrate-binding protein [Pseudomonas psychrotolerans]|nr:ABC-type transport system substrate-binding protein [Pseudomonas psychrotolerans]
MPPVSNNWGYYTNEQTDQLIAKARTSFDEQARNQALGMLHANIVDEAPFLFVAHDVGPRALSPKIGHVVQPRSWFIDIATMTMD